MDYFLYIYLSNFNFEKIRKHFLRKIFDSPHTRYWIYLLQNCFSNYVYLKEMYIILKGIFIGVKKFANLKILKLIGHLHYKKKLTKVLGFVSYL